MTKAELIKTLDQYPDDTPVLAYLHDAVDTATSIQLRYYRETIHNTRNGPVGISDWEFDPPGKLGILILQ